MAEALDSEVTGHEDDEDGEYPLDRALGVTDYGTAPDEEATPSPGRAVRPGRTPTWDGPAPTTVTPMPFRA